METSRESRSRHRVLCSFATSRPRLESEGQRYERVIQVCVVGPKDLPVKGVTRNTY